MQKEEEDEKKEKQFERMIVHAFQALMSEEEYTMSYAMAQELYNKICAMLVLVPTAITFGRSK